MRRIKINFTARDKFGRQPVGLRDARNIYTHMMGSGADGIQWSSSRTWSSPGRRPFGYTVYMVILSVKIRL